ncbi:MAG: PAS domain S-box protein [Methanoregula sp.]|nr:PAS domain S-box protein [Methanoregula sp.]
MISVLYVDDESALLEVAKTFMEHSGEFRVDTATSAREAIGKLKAERYDAVVSDYFMPEMNGIDLLKYLRPRCNGMPFIIFTGKGDEDTAIEALNSGADYYIQKGTSPKNQFAELETRIRSAVARRQSERELRVSERKYRTLLESLTETIFSVNADGVITYASPSFGQFGYEPKDLLGKDFAVIVTAEDIPAVARHFEDVQRGKATPFEFRVTDRAGQSRWVRCSCHPVTEAGQFAGIDGLISEITEHKEEDERLRLRERQYRELVDTGTDGMMILDPATGMPLGFNDEACRQLGYSREEFSRLHISDWMGGDAPAAVRAWLVSIKKEGSLTCETRYRTKTGELRNMHVSARIIDGDEKNGLCICVHDTTKTDQTERILKKSEASLRELYDQAPAAYVVLSTEGKILDANRLFLSLLGYTKDELVEKLLEEYIVPDQQSRFTGVLDTIGKTGHVMGEEFTLTAKTGQTMIISLGGTAGYDTDKTSRRYYCVLTDITGQKEETGQLRASASSAQGIIAGARDGIFTCGPDRTVTTWNPVMEEISGIAAADAFGQPPDALLPFLTVRDKRLYDPAFSGKIVETDDFRYGFSQNRKNGWARAIFSPLKNTDGSLNGIIVVIQEISSRREAEQRARAANRIYALVTRISSAGTKIRDLEVLLDEICRCAVQVGSFRIAWVGLYDQSGDLLRPVAHDGDGPKDDFLPKEGISVAELEARGWPAGAAVRKGMPVTGSVTGNGQDLALDSWENRALRQGCNAAAAVPFRLHGSVVGVISICSDEPGFFTPAESEPLAALGAAVSSVLDVLDKQALQRRTGKAGRGNWERTRFLAAALESSSVPFAIVYPDMTLGAVNPSACTFFGYTEDEILAMHWNDLVREDKGNDADGHLARVLATGIPDRYAAEGIRKDQTVVPVELSLQKMIDETSGQPCISVGIFDISALHQQVGSLEGLAGQFRTFFTEGNAAMLIGRPDGPFCAANPAACRLFGRTEEELLALGCRDLLAKDPRFIGLMTEYEQESRAMGELRLLRADGTVFDTEISVSRCVDNDGNPAPGFIILDVTEHRRNEDALARSRDFSTAILDNLPVLIRRAGTDGVCGYFNRAWYDFTGKSPAEVTGDTWKESIHPEDREQYLKTWSEHAQNHTPFENEYRLSSRSGEYHWIHETATPDFAPDGSCAGYTFTCTDIHAKKIAEAAHAESESHYRALFENAADAIFIISDVITDCSASATKLLGYTLDEIIGHMPSDFSPELQPDGRVSADAARDYISAARGGKPQFFPWINLRKDGTFLDMDIYLYPLDINGEPRVLGIANDVTERRRAEREAQRLASFPQMDPSPIIEITRDKKIVYTNPATGDILTRLGMPPDPLAFLPQDFDAILLSLDRPGHQDVCRMVQIKEASFQERICSSPGQSTLLIYAHDITDRVQAADALAYANHKLGILTSITRHDIKNKLTGVTGYLDLIRNSLKDPQLIDYLDRAESAAQAIRHHIDFTKDYETLGGTAPVWQRIDSVLAEVRSNLDPGEAGLENTAGALEIFADPMLPKVFYNLLDNSLRHGVHVRHIRVSTEKTPENGCLLVYEDDGVGVPADKKDRIFERGFTTSTAPDPSSGLGLFLVRDILSITGIPIKETGTPGTGSRFEMIVPPGKWKNEGNE